MMWTRCDEITIKPKYGHTVTPINDEQLLIYGGYPFSLPGLINLAKQTVETFENLPPVFYHTTNYVGQKFWIYGGNSVKTGKPTSNLFYLTIVSEKQIIAIFPQIEGSKTEPRAGHSSIQSKDKIIYFGGFSDTRYVNDCYLFDTERLRWDQINFTGAAPSPRAGHRSCYIEPNKMLVYGGWDENQIFGDLWILDLDNWTWKGIRYDTNPYPVPRSFHSLTLISREQNLFLLFGGRNDQHKRYFNDLWLLGFESERSCDIAVWKEIKLDNPPTARLGHAAIKLGDNLLITGGHCETGDLRNIDLLLIESNGFQTRSTQSIGTGQQQQAHYTPDSSVDIFDVTTSKSFCYSPSTKFISITYKSFQYTRSSHTTFIASRLQLQPLQSQIPRTENTSQGSPGPFSTSPQLTRVQTTSQESQNHFDTSPQLTHVQNTPQASQSPFNRSAPHHQVQSLSQPSQGIFNTSLQQHSQISSQPSQGIYNTSPQLHHIQAPYQPSQNPLSSSQQVPPNQLNTQLQANQFQNFPFFFQAALQQMQQSQNFPSLDSQIPQNNQQNFPFPTVQMQQPHLPFPYQYPVPMPYSNPYFTPMQFSGLTQPTPNFQFSAGNSSKGPKPEWNIDEVVNWMNGLGLSQDFSHIVRDEHITGSVVLGMTKEDWHNLGVTKFGDLKLLTNHLNLGALNFQM
eukprot:TRINITY_DN4734_c0_g1_i7.p1 TRINITY_DN4734_c0_g1~~TRINITY_DN4734_c0_g1_i7.p1  ORF type:complete len:681 (+),score=100.46 TRINITY_DN4734_c0_g1_i7:53-2095(+)